MQGNINKQTEGFISEIALPKLSKIKVPYDIQFPASPIEASHEITKSRYLGNRKSQTIKRFRKFFCEAVYGKII